MLAICRKVNQFYGESHILWDVDLDVPAGGCTCLMGRNGVGKTTLLKVIMGLLPARVGLDPLRRTPSCRAKPRRARARLGIGYVPQGREIFPQLTVEENLRIGLGARKGKRGDMPDRIFALFPVLKKMLRRRGGDLSGGQQQQLAIGRALVLEPEAADPRRAHRGHPALDMQRDFLEPGGFGETLGNDVSLLAKAIDPCAAALDRRRAQAGMLVIHTREGHRPDLSDAPPAKIERGAPSSASATPARWGAS